MDAPRHDVPVAREIAAWRSPMARAGHAATSVAYALVGGLTPQAALPSRYGLNQFSALPRQPRAGLKA